MGWNEPGQVGEVSNNQRPLTDLKMELAGQTRTGRSQYGARPAKKCGSPFCEGVAVKYGRMEERRQHYPITVIGWVLEVSENNYYAC